MTWGECYALMVAVVLAVVVAVLFWKLSRLGQ